MSGCYWFIPGQIKREASLMNLNVKTAVKEIEAIKNSDKTEEEKLKDINEKAIRALNRVKPHVENWNNYVYGNPSTR